MAGVSRIKSSILGRKGGFLHTYAMMESVQGSMTSGGSVPESLNSSNQATPVKIIPPTPHRKLRAKSQGGKQCTPSIPELIWVKNVRAIVVCGFFNEILKKT